MKNYANGIHFEAEIFYFWPAVLALQMK
jgi:hypothetical protein